MKKKFLIIGATLLIFIAGLIWQFQVSSQARVSQSQKNAALKELLGREVREEKVDPGLQRYEGRFFSLSYPGLVERNNKESSATKSAQIGESLKLIQFDPRRNFVVMVTEVEPGTKLSEYSAVSFRKQKGSGYLEENRTVDGQSALVFVKESDGAEKTAFVM